MDLMACTDEDEGGQEDVDHGVVWDEDQNPVGVGAQPYVVLGDEQLKIKPPKPGKKTETEIMKILNI